MIVPKLMTSRTNWYHTYTRVEQSVYALLRTRDMAVSRYKEYGIPVDWLSDSGVVGKVCSSSAYPIYVRLISNLFFHP
jgi:hypothetical protein